MSKEVFKLTTVTIKKAKDSLTELRREAIIGKEIIISDGKRKNEPDASLISTSLLDDLCESLKFTYNWVDNPDKKTGMFSLWCNELNTYGTGETREEATKDLIDNIMTYLNVFFNDLPFHLSKSNPNRKHYWYLRRIARCADTQDKLIEILNLPKED